jgi:hypothetical protein
MDKISFKQYFESKQKLKAAGEDCPKYFQEYVVSKYCKLPLLEEIGSEEKQYVALKPKDRLEIFWEVSDLVHPVPRYIKVINEDDEEKKYYFSWNLMKINKWLELSTFSSQKS